MKTALIFGALAAMAAPALATDDAIMTRKSFMWSNGASAGLAVGMMKNEIEYSPAAGNAVLKSFMATSLAFGDYFPDGTDQGDTRASPKIWEDRAGFDAALAEFQEASASGAQAGGREGPADLAAFQAAVGPILNTCNSCHEEYQLSRQ